MVNKLTADDLKQLALDIHHGKVFTDRHINPPSREELQFVFMPLAFGAFGQMTEEEVKDIGLMYEYVSEAGPRSHNGMPCFFSFRILNREQTVYVLEKVRNIQAAEKEALK